MGRIGETMDPFERNTILMFDEMKVQELYEYDIRRDEVGIVYSNLTQRKKLLAK